MKKIIIPLITIILLTGCSFRYDLKITKNNIDEIGSTENSDKSTWNEEKVNYYGKSYKQYIDEQSKYYEPVYDGTILESYAENQKVPDVEYYNVNIISTNNVYGLKYSYLHKIDEYRDSRLLNMCYETVEIENKDDLFKIKTSNIFRCFEKYATLDDVEVNITTNGDFKVLSSNADKVENNVYTWKINSDNASNKPIEIELKRVFNWKLALLIGIPSLAIIITIYLLIKNKLTKKDII